LTDRLRRPPGGPRCADRPGRCAKRQPAGSPGYEALRAPLVPLSSAGRRGTSHGAARPPRRTVGAPGGARRACRGAPEGRTVPHRQPTKECTWTATASSRLGSSASWWRGSRSREASSPPGDPCGRHPHRVTARSRRRPRGAGGSAVVATGRVAATAQDPASSSARRATRSSSRRTGHVKHGRSLTVR